MPCGALHLTPIAVRGLQETGTAGEFDGLHLNIFHQDTTAVILGAFVDPAYKLRTQHVRLDRSDEPKWDCTLSFDIQEADTQFVVEIFDENKTGAPIPLNEVFHAGKLEAWIPIQRFDGTAAGEVHLALEFVDKGLSPNQSQQDHSEVAARPDGPRATKLRQVFEKSLSKTIKSISYDKLAQSFPQIAKYSPQSLRSAHQQVIVFLQHNIQEEFQSLLESKNVVPKLNELDALIDSARKRKQTRRGMAPQSSADIIPEAAIRARTVPIKRQELRRLQDELAKAVESTSLIPVDKIQRLIDEMVPSLQSSRWDIGGKAVVR
ncbi:Nnf1-domain-containing protein [Endogone sp. FLAS-F59071]|nr:Nnf1-domain-containing protein [Endogone sp. FLAS-F59071]|eukprot:RUS19696.1 Nnf1-domain-containing protein [Endogone sp. FLAS-F59071]